MLCKIHHFVQFYAFCTKECVCWVAGGRKKRGEWSARRREGGMGVRGRSRTVNSVDTQTRRRGLNMILSHETPQAEKIRVLSNPSACRARLNSLFAQGIKIFDVISIPFTGSRSTAYVLSRIENESNKVSVYSERYETQTRLNLHPPPRLSTQYIPLLIEEYGCRPSNQVATWSHYFLRVRSTVLLQ